MIFLLVFDKTGFSIWIWIMAKFKCRRTENNVISSSSWVIFVAVFKVNFTI